MKEMFIILTILVLSSVILNSATFRLDRNPNFALLSKKEGLNDEPDIFAIRKSDKSEASFDLQVEKPETHFAKQGVFYVNISPALLPGVALGYGWISYNGNDKDYKEIIFFLHANSIAIISSAGVGILTNIFKNPARKGFFFSLNAGADYVCKVNGGLSPGGSTENDNEIYFFPNISLGGGYSLKMGKTSFLRISLDVGFKYLLTNLNISYVF